MRVSAPVSLRLRADALLADVLTRLAPRLPGQTADPTDPGWLLLEQAAWMVEQLSSSLDDYPMAVVQQLLHIMGAQLRPASPSVGAVALQADRGGVLSWPSDRPCPLRLYAPQTEDRELLEYAPVERGVALRRMRLLSLAELRDGELYRRGSPAEPDALGLWAGAAEPSGLFRDERVLFRFVAADPTALRALLEAAIPRLLAQGLGWLSFSIEEQGERSLTLVARIDALAALAAASPTVLSTAQEQLLRWGSLDDSTWTPPLRYTEHPALPARLRGRRPLPGFDEGSLVLPPLPAGLPFGALFAGRASPAPTAVCLSIWTSLVHQETRLSEYRPVLQRRYAPVEPAEPVWVGPAMDGELWHRLPPHCSLAHLRFGDQGSTQSRVGLILQGADPEHLPPIRVYAEERSGLLPAEPLTHRIAFRLPCPAPDPLRGMDLLVALEVSTPPDCAGLLICCEGSVAAVVQNPLLVVQAPAVRDGRSVTVRRSVPEAVSLLHPDLVGTELREAVGSWRVPPETRALLQGLPLASFRTSGSGPILDFAGLGLDSSSGELTLNGFDGRGQQRQLRQGETVTLDWYRRTDGARGNVPAGAIRSLEQEAGPGPLLARVINPLATWFGADREGDQAVLTRLFGPPDGIPVLPSDFERLFRAELGPRAAGWTLRVWTYAERSLLQTALWPLPLLGQPQPREVTELQRDLEAAGPEVLLVVLGPNSGELSGAELDWARQTLRGACRRIADRLPTVRDCLVAAFHPLSLRGAEPPDPPRWSLEGLVGELVDGQGRSAPAPRALLLNAALPPGGGP